MSPVTKAQRAFERAKAKYLEQLNSDEYDQLQEMSNADHLVSQAQAIAKTLQSESIDHFESKAGKLFEKLKSFESVLEGVCKLPPMGGDLIWGSISFIFEIAKDNVNVLEETLGFFVGMADEVSYLGVVENTFNGSAMVISAVEAVYVAILEFWVKAVDYYRNKMNKGLVYRIKNWLSSSRQMAMAFARLKAKLVTQKLRLHEVGTAQHHADDKAYRVRRQQKELANWIDPPHYKHDLTSAEQHRYHGTCEWLRNKQEYQDWVNCRPTALLVIYGTAGVGKTILSSWLINEERSHPAKPITLYHYFKETDDSKNTPLAATRSLLHQVYLAMLSRNHALVTKVESELQPLLLENHVDFRTLWTILYSFISEFSQTSQSGGTTTVTIVLDAMDECKDSRQLVQCLQKLVHTTSNKIRVVVTARKSGDHVDELLRLRPGQPHPIFLALSQDDVKHDIASFTKYTISQIERLADPKHYELRDRIISVFGNVKNHQGMFLWTYLMCKEVECQLEVSGIWKLLDQLPNGLDRTYALICKRLLGNDEKSREFGRVVLQWIVASRRPMTFVELEAALKVMNTNNNSIRREAFFSPNGGLLWSRKDIVKCCGDLVRYTGLDEGDTIGIVHLSARQFLSTHPSELLQQNPGGMTNVIEPFLVDIPAAELKMGITCLDYFLSTSSQAHEYSSPPIALGPARTSGQEAFKKRYPLFDYATIYWTEYVLNTLKTPLPSDGVGLEQLHTSVSRFLHSSVSSIWLEELIRLTYVEFAQNIIRHLTKLDSTVTPSDILRWADLIMKVLLGFSQTLLQYPQMVRICISQSQSGVSSGFDTITGIPPLETDIHRAWIHYDPATNNIFSATTFPSPSLRCQSMKTGVRLRPLPAVREALTKGFSFHSASVSPSADFIAITYQQLGLVDPVYLTTCWSIKDLDTTPNTDDWARLILSDSHVDEQHIFAHDAASVVAFGKNNTLFTPYGVFSLYTNECVSRPTAISSSDPTLRITHTSVSRLGSHIARIVQDDRVLVLEVLDIDGTSICKHVFDQSGALSQNVLLLGFSDAGRKVVINLREEGHKSRLFCFLVNEEREITMTLPPSEWEVGNVGAADFTRDEERFAAVIDKSYDPNWRLAVWTFLKREGGSYYDHADMIYVFGGSPFDFELIPGTSEESDVDALLVDESGIIRRQPLNSEWSPAQLEASRSKGVMEVRSVFVQNGRFPELIIWSTKSSMGVVLKVEKWSLVSSQPELVSSIEETLSSLHDIIFEPSPDGRYLATGTKIIEIRTTSNGLLDGFGACDFDFCPWEVQSATFSADGARFAAAYQEDGWKIHVFGVTEGPQLSLQATFSFPDDEFQHCSLIFSDHDPSLLAVGEKYVMKIEGNRLEIQTQTYGEPEGLNFSHCGTYCYYNKPTSQEIWPILHPLVENTPRTSGLILPALLELEDYHVCSSDILRLEQVQPGVVLLQHKVIGEHDNTYRSRVICVLPEALDPSFNLIQPYDDTFALVWPDNDNDNLKLVTVLDGVPSLIDTSIKRGELMKESEWYGSIDEL